MRLRISTRDLSENDRMITPSGKHLVVTADGNLIDNISSVTIHCSGRNQPVTAVLVVKGVHLDLLADLPPEMAAAMHLLHEDEG